MLHHDVQIQRLLGVVVENIGDHLGHFGVEADLRNQHVERPLDEGPLVLLLLQNGLQPRETGQLHGLVPVLEEESEVLASFGSFVRDIDGVDEQPKQQQIRVAVVLLSGDLFDHRPETIVLHQRVQSVRIPQPNADHHVEVRLCVRHAREREGYVGVFEAVWEEKPAVVVLLEVVQLGDELVDKHAEKTAFAQLHELGAFRNDEQSEPQRDAGGIIGRLRLEVRAKSQRKR